MQDPTQWFDQFTWWAAAHPQNNPQWCARHWAPAPVYGANGIGAAVELITKFIEVNAGKSPAQMNQAMEEMIIPQCCQLGDEEMYKIWGRWPPSGGDDDEDSRLS